MIYHICIMGGSLCRHNYTDRKKYESREYKEVFRAASVYFTTSDWAAWREDNMGVSVVLSGMEYSMNNLKLALFIRSRAPTNTYLAEHAQEYYEKLGWQPGETIVTTGSDDPFPVTRTYISEIADESP